MGVRWADGDKGLVEVTAVDGRGHVRVIGHNNGFLTWAVERPPPDPEAWRALHTASCGLAAGTGYLFGSDRRDCWALVVRVGESGDVTFVDYAEARRVVTVYEVNIAVNGRPHTVGAGRISYEEIAALAAAREGSFPTVVFSRGPDSRREGSLTAGQSTEIAAGMLFDAVVTNRA
jgi:hypothetical protein